MHIIKSLMLYCAFTTLIHAAEPSALRIPHYQRIVLRNGVTLLLMERHDVPLLTFCATVRGGALMDSADKNGAAAILADWLLKGAATRNALQFSQAIDNAGAQFNAHADLETIMLDGEFLSRDQHLAIELLADVLQRPQLAEQEFNKLRERQMEFVRAAKDSDLNELLPIYADAALFAGHPYSRSVIGDEISLNNLSYRDVLQLYQQYFGADRLIISITGDFNSAQLLPQLRKAFANWHHAVKRLQEVSAPMPLHGHHVVLIDAPDSVQSYFWIGNVGIARRNEDHVALDLVNTLFGGRFASLLNSALRINSGLSYGAHSHFDKYIQPGAWSMGSFTKTASTIEAIDAMMATYTRLRTAPLDQGDLQSVKQYVLGQYSLRFETSSQWAHALNSMEFYQLPRSDIEGYADAVYRLQINDVTQALAHWLPDEHDLLLVVIGNAEAFREALVKFGPITEMKLNDPRFYASH